MLWGFSVMDWQAAQNSATSAVGTALGARSGERHAGATRDGSRGRRSTMPYAPQAAGTALKCASER
jgi:hypothetical protein